MRTREILSLELVRLEIALSDNAFSASIKKITEF